MIYYQLSILLNAFIAATAGYLVLARNPGQVINLAFFFLSFTSLLYNACFFLSQITDSYSTALFWVRAMFIGLLFIPPSFLHFTCAFVKKSRSLNLNVILAYAAGFLFVPLDFSGLLVSDVEPVLFFRYWPVAGKGLPAFLIYSAVIYSYCLYLLISRYRVSGKSEKIQTKIVLWGYCAMLISFFNVFPLFYRVPIPPAGYILQAVTLDLLGFVILKYRLSDITLVFTKTGIFLCVYCLILSFPFLIAMHARIFLLNLLGYNWWTLPMGLMAFLATLCPFIYVFLEKKAQERILSEQKLYHNILKQAATGMTRVKEIDKLIRLITRFITKTVRINYAAVYIKEKITDEYVLASSRNESGVMNLYQKLSPDNSLISWIRTFHEPLLYDEIKRQVMEGALMYSEIEENMRLLKASLIIPSFLENQFIGFLVLGEKRSGLPYSREDLNIFRVLASQAALAIENAQFYDEARKMQEQIAQAEKMATIGTMADGLSHQINNRFHALSLISGDTLDTICSNDTSSCTQEVQEMFRQLKHAFERIQANVLQGGEVVSGLLKYSRKTDTGMEWLTLNMLSDNALEMISYKIKAGEVDIERDFPPGLPRFRGNPVQLQEVLFNCINNAHDAIMERRAMLGDQAYRGRIILSAREQQDQFCPDQKFIFITVQDNGIGIKNEDRRKIFTPFFTTKTSSRQGTGLGLYVIKRIVNEFHKGRISFESEYLRGTKFYIELPL